MAGQQLSAAQEPFRAVNPTSALDAPTYVNRSLDAGVPFALRIRELMDVDLAGCRALGRTADSSAWCFGIVRQGCMRYHFAHPSAGRSGGRHRLEYVP